MGGRRQHRTSRRLARVIKNAAEEWMGAVRTAGMIDEAVKFGGLGVQRMRGGILTGWIWLQIWFILTRGMQRWDPAAEKGAAHWLYQTPAAKALTTPPLANMVTVEYRRIFCAYEKKTHTKYFFFFVLSGRGKQEHKDLWVKSGPHFLSFFISSIITQLLLVIVLVFIWCLLRNALRAYISINPEKWLRRVSSFTQCI